jgi:2Fe-2S ferredoxin
VRAATLDGIVRTAAEGGGTAICATRHVYAVEGDPGCIPTWSENEMLEFIVCERGPNDRLSCQWVASPAKGVVGRLMETRA